MDTFRLPLRLRAFVCGCAFALAAGFACAAETSGVIEDDAPVAQRAVLRPTAPAAPDQPQAQSLEDLLTVPAAPAGIPAEAAAYSAPAAVIPAAQESVTATTEPAAEVIITTPAASGTPADAPSAALREGGPLPAKTPASQPPQLGQARGDPGALSLTLADAVLQSLSNNIELRSESLLPQLAANAVQTARAAFDPTLALGLSRTMYDRDHTSGAAGTSGSTSESTSDSFTAGLTQFAPTGTTVTLDTGVDDSFNRSYNTTRTSSQSWDGSAGVNVSQSLLKGFGLAVNLVSIRQARLDLDISRYQLQNFTESLIVDVEETYWNLVLTAREIEILEDSLRIAKQQLTDTQNRIQIETSPLSDLPEAKATVARRDLSLIEARNQYEQYRLKMLWLLNPSGENKWLHTLALDAMPTTPVVQLDPVDDHVRLALTKRPDINQSRLKLRRGELTVVRTKNGLLPELDFYVNAGGGGGNSFNTAHAYFGSDNFNVGIGANFNYALGNRAARAAHDSAQVNVTQLKLAMENLEQQIQVEVRTAFLNILRYQKQIEAAGLARESYAESLRAEQEKLKSGKSTAIAVSIAQNNYMDSRLSEARAIINTIKSLTALYRYDGSLLLRRGVVIPGK